MRVKSNYSRLSVATVAVVLQGLSLSSAAAAEAGPVAVYNEAVRIVDGKRVVELPPKLTKGNGSNKKPTQSEPHLVIETPSGLVDCTNAFYDPQTCQPSSYGVAKQHRAYVVKVKGRWLACPRRDVETPLCLVIGGGKFMPIETTWE